MSSLDRPIVGNGNATFRKDSPPINQNRLRLAQPISRIRFTWLAINHRYFGCESTLHLSDGENSSGASLSDEMKSPGKPVPSLKEASAWSYMRPCSYRSFAFNVGTKSRRPSLPAYLSNLWAVFSSVKPRARIRRRAGEEAVSLRAWRRRG